MDLAEAMKKAADRGIKWSALGFCCIVLAASPCHMEHYVLSTFARKAVFLGVPTQMCVSCMFLRLLTEMEYVSTLNYQWVVNALPGSNAREENRALSILVMPTLSKQGWRLVLLNYCKWGGAGSPAAGDVEVLVSPIVNPLSANGFWIVLW